LTIRTRCRVNNIVKQRPTNLVIEKCREFETFNGTGINHLEIINNHKPQHILQHHRAPTINQGQLVQRNGTLYVNDSGSSSNAISARLVPSTTGTVSIVRNGTMSTDDGGGGGLTTPSWNDFHFPPPPSMPAADGKLLRIFHINSIFLDELEYADPAEIVDFSTKVNTETRIKPTPPPRHFHTLSSRTTSSSSSSSPLVPPKSLHYATANIIRR
jgi:hypothetical protein